MGDAAGSNALADFDVSLKNLELFDARGLVAGSWTNATSDKTFIVWEPSTGRPLGRCSDFSRDDFLRAIEAADTGYKKFHRSTTAKGRGRMLRSWGDLIITNKSDLATILSLENGKTKAEAEGEVEYAASFVFWFAEEATRSYGDVIPSSSQDTMVLTFKEPVGVCGIITPWNFPAAMITRKIAPALAAGCSVVIKPPSETPFTAIALAKLALLAGLPADCIHVVPTKDREAATELATHPKVCKLSFTGSTGVGKLLTRLAAGTMKRVSMELGGNAPFIVFQDADLDKAVEGAMACKFRCTGQTCVCANRLYAHSSIADEFAKKLAEKVKALKLGRGVDDGITQGPLVNKAAVVKVSSHVDDALSKGGELLTGGKVPQDLQDGFFYEPTVIANGNSSMSVATDETFGPLAVIFPFNTDAEVISMANDTEFGLASYFYTTNNNRLLRVAQALQCGMVGVNTGVMSAAETPFGGTKESGYGREGSKYGLAEYQTIKAVTVRY
ncbi:hypothetical protein LTR41_010963 [Exophiala xenobiotica]|nr:hypothetical protein LTR41_010963 [Exophiala xenobiotica]KAK5551131.1 hypothetical protein LTR46_010884 [Exophiala xenobiotica]